MDTVPLNMACSQSGYGKDGSGEIKTAENMGNFAQLAQ